MNVTLRKIKNVAIAAALAAGFAGVSALSNLSAVQAQYPQYPQQQYPQKKKPSIVITNPESSPQDLQKAYHQGLYWGGDDSSQGASFRPCAHQEYIDGNVLYRKAFIRGYLVGYQ